MTNLKKLGALLLVVVMMLSLSVSAFASGTVTLGGTQTGVAGARDDSATALDNSVLILKELKVYNTTSGNIYLPTVGYDYTIAAATVANAGTTGATVTDSGNHVAFVYSGDADALTTSAASVDFSASTTTGYTSAGATTTITQPTAADAGGTSYYGGFTVGFDPSKFDHAGVYRYVITEAEDATNTLIKAGVVHDNATNYSATRYLDVYVRRAVTTDTAAQQTAGYVIYGYVVFNGTADTSISSADESSKTNGYVGENGADEYNTWNLIVTKAITGSLAETAHQFPFQVVFTSPNATAATIHYTATNGLPSSATTATLSSAAATTIGALNNSSTLKLTNNGSVTFYGIPAGVTATVQENNDTYDVYTASATITAATAQTYTANQVQSNASATIITGLNNATTTAQVGSADTTTAWTNDLTVVSPTGVAFRVAPYVLMLAAGIVLVMISRKRKAAEEA